MRKFVLVLLGVVILLIVALLAAPFLIPADTYRTQLEAQVERATGRTLKITGPVELGLLPSIAIRAQDVRFANPPGAASADMARLRTLEVELKVLPLLRGRVEVDRFVLIEPQIHLEVDAQGRPNWQFGEAAGPRGGTPDAAGEAPAGEGSPAGTQEDASGQLPVRELALGDIRVENGVVTYADAASGASERIEAIDMTVDLESLESPLGAEGAFRYKGQPVEVDFEVETPLALIQGSASRLRAVVKSPRAAFTFTGEVSNASVPGAAGKMELDVPSLRELSAWLAQPIEFAGEALQDLKVAGQLDATPEQIAFSEATIVLDDIEASGALTANLAGRVPRLTGNLAVGALDLNPYLPAEEGAAGRAEGQAGGNRAATPRDRKEEAAGEGWSNEPIAIPPLTGFEVEFEFSAESIAYQDVKTGPAVVDLRLQGGTLTVGLTDLRLYGGRGVGSFRLATAEPVPAIESDFRIENLDTLPFLTALAEFDSLAGRANTEIKVKTRGRSQRELVENLNGRGKALLRDGAIVGFNLAAMVRNARSAFLNPEAAEERKTDFAELSGSFRIRQGVVTNDDLRLQAPALRLAGKGRVNMPERTLQFRVEPKAAATLKGQGGRQDVAGLLVPVVVAGPWDDLSFKPDLSGVLESAIQDPEAIKRQADQLKEQVEQGGEALGAQAKELKQKLRQGKEGGAGGLLEGVAGALNRKGEGGGEEQDAGEQGGAEQKGDPAQQLLKGLFGNQ